MTDAAYLTLGRLQWTLTTAGRELFSDGDLDLEAHIAAGRATVVKHGQHRTVYRVVFADGNAVYWKHCRLNGPRAWWRDFFRGPKAKLEFDRARAWLAVGWKRLSRSRGPVFVDAGRAAAF